MNHEDTDGMLMAKVAKGDATAFDQIVAKYQHQVQRFAIRMFAGDATQGADAALAAFIKLWETRRSYRERGCLSSWLYTTTYRLCVDILAKGSPLVPLDSELHSIQIDHEKRQLSEAVREAVSVLPEAQRAVLILTTYEGLSYEEASEVLGVPAGTVASRRSQALKTLRRRLAAWEENQ